MQPTKEISPQALEKLKSYDWPGNIRELENTIERAHIIAKRVIQPENILLPEKEPHHIERELPKTLKAAAERGREFAEAQLIQKTLEETGGNKSKAAHQLEVSYKTLLTRIKRYKDRGLL